MNVYSGNDSSKVLCNIEGDTVYEGRGSSNVICNFAKNQVYDGRGSANVLFNIANNIIYNGKGVTNVFCNIDGNVIYSGNYRGEVIGNINKDGVSIISNVSTKELAAILFAVNMMFPSSSNTSSPKSNPIKNPKKVASSIPQENMTEGGAALFEIIKTIYRNKILFWGIVAFVLWKIFG